MSAPSGTARRATALRAVEAGLWLAFWVPLAGCTWLALTPSPPDAVFRVSDVLLHGFAFSYLAFALGLAHRLRPLPVALWLLAYGAGLELLQSQQPGRMPEFKDLAVDAAGIAVGLALLWALGARVRRLAQWVLERLLPGH
ncbi:MAG: VanZ family protein [Pseudomonadota bacterium]